jgi:alkyldihydroxyacetonephosphate synthase
MGVLTRVSIRISRIPEKDDVYGIFFPSWGHGRDAVRSLAEAGIPYSMIRLSNSAETMTNLSLVGQEKQITLLKRYLRFRGIPDTDACMCLIGFIGTQRMVKTARYESFSILKQYKGLYVGKAMGKAWKKKRFKTPYLRNTLWDYGYATDTVETAVTWDKVTPTLEAIENVIKRSLMPWNEKVHVFSHLSHIYSTGSSIYTTYIFRLADTPEETLERWKTIKKAVSQTIVKFGGTISHQHGVGMDHKPYLEAEKGSVGIGILKNLFNHTDPEKRMNPSKMLS